MALQNQPGMYQGTPSLNPLPYVNIAMQARARKAAREEAIDKYYQKLPDTINDKGVRDQEIPIINEFKNKIFEFGVKNREALRNPKVDNGAAQLNLDKLMREAASIARLSQNAAKADLNAGKFFLNKDNQYALNSDEYIADNELHNLPVTDPRHKTLDLEKFAANRPFDEQKFVKDIKSKFEYDTKEVRTPDPDDSNYENVAQIPILNEKQKIRMVADAADRFHNDPTFRKKISKDLAGTGQLQDMIQIAKDVFGVPQEELDDEMLAAAYTYSKLPIGKTKEKVQANYTNRTADKNAEWDRRNKITFEQSKEKIRLNNENRKAGLPTEDTGYLSDEVANEVGRTERVTEKGVTTERVVIYVDDIDPKRLNIITGNGSVKPITFKGGRRGFFQDPVTKDWEGRNSDDQKSVISRERVKDDYNKIVAPTKFKNQTGTKGSENTVDFKKTTSNKANVPGWNN